MYPTLFKKDTTGAIRQWHVEQEGHRYRMVSGQVAGQLVASEWTEAKGKNIGRANATNGEDQAVNEIKAAYTKKKKEGYQESVELAHAKGVDYFEPMLAKKYEEYCNTEFPWNFDGKGAVFAQGKLDGIRCIGTWNRIHTRKGEPIPACFHVLRALENVPENMILDGELYNHDLKDNFNEIASLVRKTKGWEKHQEKISATIQYWVYDCFFLDAPELTFQERYNRLLVTLTAGVIDQNIVKILGADEVKSQAELDAHYEKVLGWGMEGQIVRLDTPYENKRTKSLLKRKEFQDEEFIIADVLEGIGNRSGMAGSLVLHLNDGRTFDSGIKGGRDHYRYLLAKRTEFIGKPATIRYFHYTPAGIPRFPVCVDIGRGD